jgi:hypothetical protein
LSSKEPQTLINEFYLATKILDFEYKQAPASIDDVIRKCEKLHVEEPHQLEKSTQKYEYQFVGALREFNMM